MLRPVTVAVSVSLIITLPAAGAGLSNRDFLQGCQIAVHGADPSKLSRTQEMATIFCAAYVAGLMEGAAVKTHYPSRLCLPLNLRRDEGFRAIVEQMRGADSPSHGHGEIVLAAAARAFPCRR